MLFSVNRRPTGYPDTGTWLSPVREKIGYWIHHAKVDAKTHYLDLLKCTPIEFGRREKQNFPITSPAAQFPVSATPEQPKKRTV
jgi:hypothetical protein